MFRPSRMVVVASLLTVSFSLLTPRMGWAQQNTLGAFAGSAQDETGAVLPGVTVEARSPALIEGVRTAFTDGAGNYRITDLRPGTYSVTFTLPGFNTFVREGIELSAGFTATVHAELGIGAVEETVTVTGASPVVDVQNVRVQETFDRELLEAVPTSKSFMGMQALTLGANGGGANYFSMNGDRDVGGSNHEGIVALKIHGSRAEGGWSIEGMRGNSLSSTGTARRYMINNNAIQEVAAETGARQAEAETGGIGANFILREGGNIFSGMFETEYTGEGLQNANINDELVARGISQSNQVQRIYSIGGGFGGPIVRDRLWFYTAYRSWGTSEAVAGIFHNKRELLHTPFYEPNFDDPLITNSWTHDTTSRLTLQAAESHKLSGIVTLQSWCACPRSGGAGRAPESLYNTLFPFPLTLTQVNWTNPATNRLLFEAGFAYRGGPLERQPNERLDPGDYSYRDLGIGIIYGPWHQAPRLGGPYGRETVGSRQFNYNFAMSYVTGSHAFKVGTHAITGRNPNEASVFNTDFPIQLQMRNRVPVRLWMTTTQSNYHANVRANLGIFAQDQWTFNRVTLNLGVRYDHLNAYTPASTRPAGFFFPEISFPEQTNLPNWHDVSPRLGMAWDLTGDGRTALKASLGRYVLGDATRIASQRNPQRATVDSTFRNWNDLNEDYFPDCDLRSTSANGECGAVDESGFGQLRFGRDFDPDYLNGWYKRQYNWEGNVSLEHELADGVSLSVGYFYRSFGNLEVTENTAVGPEDFMPYSVTVPSDSRLPGGGGQVISGFYDINPDAFGRSLMITHTDGGLRERFNGVDVALSARFGNGGLLNAGVATGKSTFDFSNPESNIFNCVNRAGGNVQLRAFCETDDREDQVKVSVSYPLPGDIQVAAVYQNIPGTTIGDSRRYAGAPTMVVPNSAIAPQLGRDLGACRGRPVCNAVVVVPIVSPESWREARASQLDFRISKSFQMDGVRLRAGFDIYNALNSSDVLSVNSRYGGAFLRPGSILPGRLYKFNLLMNF